MRYFWLSILLIFSCRQQTTSDNDLVDLKAKYFKDEFIKKFKVMSIPSVLPEGKQLDLESIPDTNPNSLDSLITGRWYLQCYGMFPDTSNFYTLFFYAPAATMIPVIETYDKYGNKISGEGIDMGCWDGGPVDYDCEGSVTIDSDFNIRLSHTTTCYDCDSTSTKPTKYLDSREGKINKTGLIEFAGERTSKKIE